MEEINSAQSKKSEHEATVSAQASQSQSKKVENDGEVVD